MLDLNIPTFIFVIINMTVLYFLLKRFLFKPVTNFMDKRKKSIIDSIEEAERKTAEAENIKQTYEKYMKETRRQADKIMTDAYSRADKQYNAIIKEARQEAECILQKAKDEIEKERIEMLKEIKSQVADIALTAASKLLEVNMDTESNRVLVDKFIDEAGAA